MNTGEDPSLYYSNILNDLKSLELNDSEETEKTSKVTEYKRELCSDKQKSILNKLSDDLSNCSVQLAAKLCELIAELAKDEECRSKLVEADLFVLINKFFTDPTSTNNLKIQLCRAIGNLCYENDDGRSKFLDHDGVDGLFALLKYCGNTDVSSINDPDGQKELNKLVMVSLGCLHNVTNENDTLRKAAYDKNVMNVLKLFIKHIKSDMVYFLSCIENLTDSDEGKSQFTESNFAMDLYKSLDQKVLEGLDSLYEDFFRVLSSLNDIKNTKESLCETEFLQTLINFIENNIDDEELVRNFGGFLTNMLANDDNIDVVFNYKNNLVLEKATEWLDKYESEQLYLSSAVIIANYMRSDEKALKLVQHKNQPHVKIINILKKYNKFGTKATLQQINVSHSLLSTLKNFCIAASSKEELIKHEVIEVVLNFLNYENLEVTWKALSIIRLLVKSCNDKNGLNQIFTDETLQKIDNISNNPQDHPGVAGESSRLCCYLPIAAKSEKNIEKYCKFKLINVVCKQLKSEHLIMLNEALLAINVLITINYRACCAQLKESVLNENLTFLFEKETLPIEMRINSFKIFKSLFERSDFFTEEQLENYMKAFKKLKLGQENEIVNSFLNQLINLIENTL